MDRSGIGTKLLAVSIVLMLAMTAYFAVESRNDSDAVIIFTNDVHNAYNENIGYDGLMAYKKEKEREYDNVLLVDSGDFLHGGALGIMEGGDRCIIDIMGRIGYDVVTLGNHEFDNGADALWSLLRESGFETVCCNISYTGEKMDPLDFMHPYTIRKCGQRDIAFIGVTTPTIVTSPSGIMEDGRIVYDFCGGDGKRLYASVQNSIDACKEQGADDIILLSHLGDTSDPPYTSVDVAKNTSGLTCILDGHQHSVIERIDVKDKEGKDVFISSTGTRFANIGCLTIDDGGASVKLVNSNDYAKKDADTTADLNRYSGMIDEYLGRTAFTLPMDLPITDMNGARTVKNQETAIGNLAADALRALAGADVGMIDAGDIRMPLHAGITTVNELYKFMPYVNYCMVTEVTGWTLFCCLEMSCHKMTRATSEGSTALGEFNGFQSVSGIRFDVNPDIRSPVILDSNGKFLGLNDSAPCRVGNVKVMNRTTGQYEPLDMGKKYTVCSTDYMIMQHGYGFTMFKDSKLLCAWTISLQNAFADYARALTQEQLLERYSHTDGRINRI